jgi:hypothetical protein
MMTVVEGTRAAVCIVISRAERRRNFMLEE